jgi:AcrR family transcriptional regulator
VTLAEIAEEAGVSVQTVIRHHGGREGVLEAMGRRAGERIDAQRMAVEPGDVEGAVDNVLEHYENDGDLVLQILSEEAASEFAARAASEGRIFHRRWVERVFGPLLGDDDLEEKIDALVVATDIYTWRLLRRDLRRDLEDVRGVMLRLVRANLGETP